MAIFGSLQDLPFVEVISTISRKTGRLLLWELPKGISVELHVSAARLRSVLVNGQSTALVDARTYLLELANENRGRFEFHNLGEANLRNDFDVPLAQALLSANAVQGLQNQEYFPDPKTRFVHTARTDELFLGLELDEFWERARPALEQGASAEQLAAKLEVPVLMVRSHLYRLRAAGRVAPLRVFTTTAPSAPSSSSYPAATSHGPSSPAARPVTPSAQPAAPQPTSLLGRLLGALRGMRRA